MRPPQGTFTQVSTGFNSACAIRTTGSLVCWGSNSYGKSRPPSGRYLRVSVGETFGCAIRANSCSLVLG